MNKCIIHFIRRSLSALTEMWRNRKIYVGRDPRHVFPRSVVLFPLADDTLFCGLAGILTVTQERRPVPRSIVADLSTAVGSIIVSGLGEVLKGSVTLDHYLGGADLLETFNRLLRQLKYTSTFEILAKDSESVLLLEDLCSSMKEFVASEELLIDERAERFFDGTDRTD